MSEKKKSSEKQKEEKPHYHGHRERLRKKIYEHSDAVDDYEILEAILFLLLPRIDTKPIAKNLISQFKTLAGVLNAPPKELMKIEGIRKTTALNLKIINAAASRQKLSKILNTKEPVIHKDPALHKWRDIFEYCIEKIAHSPVEEFRVLYINDKNMLIADEAHQTGTINFTPAYPREIVKRTLEIGASALILVHNHPSGDATPSKADVNITEKIIKIASTMEIEVLDHIIVSKNNFASMKGKKLVSIWKD